MAGTFSRGMIPPILDANNDGSSPEVKFSYTPNSDSSANDNVQFHIYASDGTHMGTATEESDETVTLTSGEKVFIVVESDTTGMTTSDDLGGT